MSTASELTSDTDVAIVRSFGVIASALEQHRIENKWCVSILGVVAYGNRNYSIYRLTNTQAVPGKPTVLLSGGVHGDEPAGVYTLLEFLRSPGELSEKFNFVIYPCVNPSGFEVNTNETRAGINLNRRFGTADPPLEIRLIQSDLGDLGLNFKFSMDLHECPPYWEDEGFKKADNPHATWLYESQRDPSQRLGRAMIDSLPADLAVCDWPMLYNDYNDRGVIHFLPETTGNAIYAQCTTFDAWCFANHTSHTFTTETPTGWSLEDRIRTQLHYITTALGLVN